jgi:hypothetical protein
LHSQLGNETVYQPRPVQPFVAPAWKLNWQGVVLAIPAVDYHELTLLRGEGGELVVGLQNRAPAIAHPAGAAAISQAPVKLVLSRRAETERLVEDIQVAALGGVAIDHVAIDDAAGERVAVVDGVAMQRVRGRRSLGSNVETVLGQNEADGLRQAPQDRQRLIRRLFGKAMSQDELLDLAYRNRSEDLSCAPAEWEADLPIALALKQKLDSRPPMGEAVVAAYAQVGDHPGWVIRHRSQSLGASGAQAAKAPEFSGTPRTEWKIRIKGSAASQQAASELWMSLPEDHASADVGLGAGQDNWWEAQNRPAWLDALETAIATDTPAAWHQLALALDAARFSENSVKSVQQAIAVLNARSSHESRLFKARSLEHLHPAETQPKTAR